jgi:putative membrane protein
VGAVLALMVALVSPLDAMSGVLFSAHMAQHLLLILVAAPLLVLSDFPLAFLWALPQPLAQLLSRRVHQSNSVLQVWRVLTAFAFAWLAFTIALWLWHAPVVYEAALRDDAIHIGEHIVFLLIAMLFWWGLFKPVGHRTEPDSVHYAIAILYLFATAMQSGILGALMTFTSQPWYPYYAPLVISWGLTPLQDQQLAGLLMWLPGGAVFTLLTIGYFAAWFRALERRTARMPQRDLLLKQ